MIDKLDLRIPHYSVLRPFIEAYIRWGPSETYSSRVRPALHYLGKADLRPLGIDAILHIQCKHGEKDSKLEVLDVGKKPYSRIVNLVENVARVNPDELGIMRIDLTADVRGITVPWLKSHVRFKFKRTENEYGQLTYGLVGHGEVETILAGSRPNVFRIYNKTKECQFQFRRLQRRVSKDAEPLEFEKVFGLKEADILTRIERQCGGSRIPPEIARFSCLRNIPNFNPFNSLEIITSGQSNLPLPEECDGLEYYTGYGMHVEAQQMGMQEFRKKLNKQTKGNAARTLERYERFFPDGTDVPITLEQIIENFRQSTIEQLSA